MPDFVEAPNGNEKTLSPTTGTSQPQPHTRQDAREHTEGHGRRAGAAADAAAKTLACWQGENGRHKKSRKHRKRHF